MKKKSFKKLLALSLATAMVATGFPVVSEMPVVEAAIASSSNVEVSSVCNNRYPSDTVVKYNVGSDIQNGSEMYIVVTYNSDYNSSNNPINETTIKTIGTGNGVVKVVKETSPQDGDKYLTVSDLGTTKEGDYTVYYMIGSSLNQSTFNMVKGPVITNAKFETFGNGFEMRFKNDNEYFSYTWTVYDKLPTDTSASTPDSNSGSGVEDNYEAIISSNSLEKNKTYYLVLEVTGDTSGAKYTYGSGTTKYYQFHTKNDDTEASGENTSGSSSSSSSSSSSGSSTPTTTKKQNSDGSVTETTTSKTGTQTTKVVSTTWTDKTTKKVERSHVINTVTDSTTGETKMRDTDKQGDGSYIENYIVVQKDKSYTIESTEATSSGTKSVTAAAFSASGAITAVAERTLNKNNETTFETNYKVSSGKKLTVSKITSSKATIDISDLVTVSSMTSFKDTEGIVTKDTDYQVNAIGAKVLKGNKKVKKIIINSDIKTIGKNAFSKAKNLKTIELAGPLTKVGKGAFNGINSKATITVIASKAKFKDTKSLLKKAGVAKTVKIKKA